MTPRHDSRTRGALLESAGEIFAEVGFQAASIRAICARAGSNVAAVHYHFGTKEALYEAVCGTLFLAPPPQRDGGKKPRSRSAAARDLIGGIVDTLLSREETWRTRIVRRELMAPTPAVIDVIARAMAPRWAALEEALGRIAPRVTLAERRRQLAALIGELLFLRDARPLLQAMHGAASWALDRETQLEGITRGFLARLEASRGPRQSSSSLVPGTRLAAPRPRRRTANR
jgi:AcrR family transcriptional regulator